MFGNLLCAAKDSSRPTRPTRMEPEIELELFAALCADVEAGRPLVDVLRAEGLSESAWNHSRDAWMGRMSHGPDNDRKAFEERYLVAFHARKRMTAVRDVVPPPPESIAPNSAEIEEPPTRRAPMGTVITLDSAAKENVDEPANTSSPKDPPPSATPPMGVIVPTFADPLPARPAPSSEYTPPMGVAAPNLADIPPPRPLPHREHTPPMGVAAPNLADIPPPRPLPNPEHTPPMGVAVPNLSDGAQQRPRRAPEPTPPMRPRSELVPDDMARFAADVVSERKTDPPPPVPSRPALPFPSSMQGAGYLPVPQAPPSAAFRPQAGSYPAAPAPVPAPAPVAPPMNFQQPAPQPQPPASPTFGAYPSMMNLAAQAGGPVPPAPASSAGFPPPAKAPGPPLALGGFQATASGPRLSLDVYARFAAEIAVKPVEVAEIRERYGFTDVTHTAEDEAWQRRFSSDRETYVRYAKLFQHYRDWYSGRTPR